jgi:hypothetical protein
MVIGNRGIGVGPLRIIRRVFLEIFSYGITKNEKIQANRT